LVAFFVFLLFATQRGNGRRQKSATVPLASLRTGGDRRYIIRKNLNKALAMPLAFDNLSLLRFMA